MCPLFGSLTIVTRDRLEAVCLGNQLNNPLHLIAAHYGGSLDFVRDRHPDLSLCRMQ